jgi:signal transduction histidine kinase
VRTPSQRKDEFLATLAHELRNPLAPSALRHGHPGSGCIPSRRWRSWRHVVDRQVSHLKRLVDDLLDVARITSGKVMLQVATPAPQR